MRRRKAERSPPFLNLPLNGRVCKMSDVQTLLWQRASTSLTIAFYPSGRSRTNFSDEAERNSAQ